MFDLLRRRRSIRSYKNRPIEPEKIALLKEAELRAPSSRSIMPWRFIFVTDKEVLYRLSIAKEDGSQFLKGASLGVVVCADETMSDVWIEDCSIAAIILQLAGLELGIGSCWVQIRNRKTRDGKPSESYVRGVLGIPDNMRILMILSMGYPDEDLPPVSIEDLDFWKAT